MSCVLKFSTSTSVLEFAFYTMPFPHEWVFCQLFPWLSQQCSLKKFLLIMASIDRHNHCNLKISSSYHLLFIWRVRAWAYAFHPLLISFVFIYNHLFNALPLACEAFICVQITSLQISVLPTVKIYFFPFVKIYSQGLNFILVLYRNDLPKGIKLCMTIIT